MDNGRLAIRGTPAAGFARAAAHARDRRAVRIALRPMPRRNGPAASKLNPSQGGESMSARSLLASLALVPLCGACLAAVQLATAESAAAQEVRYYQDGGVTYR